MLRPVVMGQNGAVTSSHHLATCAGLEILKEGGNAFDAAITVNAVLGVVQPHRCGIGGDGFYLLYSAKQHVVLFLNGSGRSPLEAGIETFRRRGYEKIPERGVLAVTVPGCVHAWGEIWHRLGHLPLPRLLAPAVHYARKGFPLSYRFYHILQNCKESIWQESALKHIFYRYGRLCRPGDIIKQENLAQTLELIGKEGTDVFYKGELARKIHKYMEKKKGLLSLKDMELHTSSWGEPLCISYGDKTMYQTPPNTQGLAALLAFNILEGMNLENNGSDKAEMVHYLVEIKKLAYQYREQYITDPDFVPLELDYLLDKQFAARLQNMVEPGQASQTEPSGETPSDAACFAVTDKDGNMVSAVQGLNALFGSGCCIEETGIILQNTGVAFSLDPIHINRLEPHKRTFHNLTACLVTQEDMPLLAFCTGGGNAQPQIHLQVLSRILNSGDNIQNALEEPRWVHGLNSPGGCSMHLNMEGRFPVEVITTLESWGHNVRLADDWAEETGEALALMNDRESGVMLAGADPRGEGYALAW